MNETRVVIQLVDRSQLHPKGVVEDVLIMVDDLIFPADFYVIDMGLGIPETPIILGRPFLRTAKAKIDCYTGSLTVEVDGKKAEYLIPDGKSATYYLNLVDVVDIFARDIMSIDRSDQLQVVLDSPVRELSLDYALPNNLQELSVAMDANSVNWYSFYKPELLKFSCEKLLPSVI